MSAFPEPLLLLAALAAFVAIGPWVKVASADTDALKLRALSQAAIPTAMALGIFVFGIAATLIAQAL